MASLHHVVLLIACIDSAAEDGREMRPVQPDDFGSDNGWDDLSLEETAQASALCRWWWSSFEEYGGTLTVDEVLTETFDGHLSDAVQTTAYGSITHSGVARWGRRAAFELGRPQTPLEILRPPLGIVGGHRFLRMRTTLLPLGGLMIASTSAASRDKASAF